MDVSPLQPRTTISLPHHEAASAQTSNMRLSKSFAFMSNGSEHNDTPTELKRRRSSLDSFVIPRRTRLPSSKQSQTGQTELDIIGTLFNHNQNTLSDKGCNGENTNAWASPRTRRALSSPKLNKENDVPMPLKSPKQLVNDIPPEEARLSTVETLHSGFRQAPYEPGNLSPVLRAGDGYGSSRNASSSYCSERPGSMRSAKEYNHLARQYQLPRFDYKHFEQHCMSIPNQTSLLFTY